MDVFTLIISMGVLQGLILAILLLKIKKRNKVANEFLALFLILISFTMLGRLLREIAFFKTYPNFLALPDAIIFLYGPLMYMYLKKLLTLPSTRRIGVLVMFTPAILFLVSEAPLLLNENHHIREFWTRHTRIRFILIEGFAIAQNCYFFILQCKLFLKYQEASNDNFSYKQYPSYLRIIYGFIALALLLWLASYFSWVFGYYNMLSVIGYRLIWLILPFLTYSIGYFAMREPDLFKMNISKNISERKIFTESERCIMLKRIKEAMEKNKFYKNPDFSLSILSDSISFERNKLSKLINDEFNKNFNDWTNDYRINDAQNMLLNSSLSIKEVYFKVGFNSKSTFNRAFKNKLGKTPTDFRLHK